MIISLKFSHLGVVHFITLPLTLPATYIKAEYNQVWTFATLRDFFQYLHKKGSGCYYIRLALEVSYSKSIPSVWIKSLSWRHKIFFIFCNMWILHYKILFNNNRHQNKTIHRKAQKANVIFCNLLIYFKLAFLFIPFLLPDTAKNFLLLA